MNSKSANQHIGNMSSSDMLAARIADIMSEYGDGARAIVHVDWKHGSLEGHVFVVEMIRGKIHYFDPQSGSMDFRWILSYVDVMRATIFRTDDKLFTETAKEMFEW